MVAHFLPAPGRPTVAVAGPVVATCAAVTVVPGPAMAMLLPLTSAGADSGGRRGSQ
ncbi:hypothetical protein GCM10022384_69210 [Streptomyces marokkonensis]|uniref:Uncharacterized protein n=1 Tax=Streptomyces marokkonensis TaxID=324855 RepID=A0ABP7STK0_9ACTN